MKSTSDAPSGIVHQVLTKDNYERWKGVMQNYLQGQGLWDVVQSAEVKTEANSKTTIDAKGLHVFQLSRGREVLETVKKSCNHLSPQNGTDQSKVTPDIEQGLCVVVQSVSEVETEALWKAKDAKALHIIQLSCGREIVNEIGHFKTAKSVWNHLSKQYGNELKASRDTEQAVLGDSLGKQHKELFTMVERGDYIGDIIDTSTEINIWITSASGRTLLHDTVIAGNEENVKKLLGKGRERDICMPDYRGYTALALAARYTGNTAIAKCLVESNDGIGKPLLIKQNKDKNKDVEMPVFLAAANGHKEMTIYLYSVTPHREVFETNSRNRVLLLSLCITAEIFDTALRLLKRYPDLPKESLSKFYVPEPLRDSLSLPSNISDPDSRGESKLDKFSALEALAKMPSAFPSGTRFSCRTKFIYNMLSADREFEVKYGISNIAQIVQSVTSFAAIADKRRQKTSSASWSGFVRQVLNLLAETLSGLLSRGIAYLFVQIFKCPHIFGLLRRGIAYLFVQIFKCPHIFGLLRRGIAYLFVQIFKCPSISGLLRIHRGIASFAVVKIFKSSNTFGIMKLYDQKCTHYEVLVILHYFCRSIEEFNDLQLKEASAYEAMLHAAQHGIIEFINAMRKAKPDLLSAVDSCHRGIFSYAILYRKQNVFQLIHRLHGRKEIFRYHRDMFGNNLLHLAAYLGPSSDRDSKSGAALQMQREIQWFKAVKEVVYPKYKEAKNSDGKKPYELFTENHDELVKAGEKWAKETATSFTIVGTLIITIMFAAAFTVPGGNNQDTGLPIFLHNKNHKIFTTFLVADATSLFTSATSVLIFIGILTSRYAEKDFLKSLPWKLWFGLFFLFLSVCSMIVAFWASIIMIFKGYRPHRWFILGPIMSLGGVPIIVLLVSQLRLMIEVLHSTLKNPISSIKE